MADDMPGTIWEAWTGDATHSDGSKNHPMARLRAARAPKAPPVCEAP